MMVTICDNALMKLMELLLISINSKNLTAGKIQIFKSIQIVICINW